MYRFTFFSNNKFKRNDLISFEKEICNILKPMFYIVSSYSFYPYAANFDEFTQYEKQEPYHKNIDLYIMTDESQETVREFIKSIDCNIKETINKNIGKAYTEYCFNININAAKALENMQRPETIVRKYVAEKDDTEYLVVVILLKNNEDKQDVFMLQMFAKEFW